MFEARRFEAPAFSLSPRLRANDPAVVKEAQEQLAKLVQDNLGDEVDLEDYVNRPERVSGADIAAICQEAGLHAVRKNRYVILSEDFDKGYKSNTNKKETEYAFYR